MTGSVRCPRCHSPLNAGQINADAFTRCHSCRAALTVQAYPALIRNPEAIDAGNPLTAEKQAGCYYHPAKEAAVPCDFCGRFLCGLCDLEIDGRHICPSCLQNGKQKGELRDLETRFTRYDNIALALAAYPLFFVFPTMVTAPVALYMVLRYWKTPRSVLPRNRLRFIAAGLLATLQVIGWAAFWARQLL